MQLVFLEKMCRMSSAAAAKVTVPAAVALEISKIIFYSFFTVVFQRHLGFVIKDFQVF